MKTKMFLLSVLAATVATTALGQDAPSAADGKVVYDHWCVHCHGAVAPEQFLFGGGTLPGTGALQVKYDGQLPAVLEERTDLDPEFIRTVVRGGLFGMPITRKTEISDAELEDIIAYLTGDER